MATRKEQEYTRRAYTMRLDGPEGHDGSWREPLLHTHNVFNEGVRLWSDLLLTLCGGLDAKLADEVEGEERRLRRIYLALSWLRVESEDELNAKWRVHQADLGSALESILRKAGLQEETIREWRRQCEKVLESPIRVESAGSGRTNACWVNRAAKFEELYPGTEHGLNQKEIWDVIERFQSKIEYLRNPGGEGQEEREEGNKNIKAARRWLSNRLGTGEGNDYGAVTQKKESLLEWTNSVQGDWGKEETLRRLAEEMGWPPDQKGMQEAMRKALGAKGAPSGSIRRLRAFINGGEFEVESLRKALEKEISDNQGQIGKKGRKGWSDAFWQRLQDVLRVDYNVDLLSAMLGSSAIRVFSNWTWNKRSIAEREEAGRDRSKLAEVPELAKRWLEEYCGQREGQTGAQGGYRIRKRAIAGWKEVLDAWDDFDRKTPEDRISAVGEVQSNMDSSKFGDASLFISLASEEAKAVWMDGGRVRPEILTDYVLGTHAQYVYENRKVPVFRHAHAVQSPVFLDFGDSRPGVRYHLHDAENSQRNLVELQLVSPKSGRMTWFPFRWRSGRVRAELMPDPAAGGSSAGEAPRRDRFGPVAVGIGSGTPFRVPLFGSKGEEKAVWNAKLQFPRDLIKHRNLKSLPSNCSWSITLGAELKTAKKRTEAPPFEGKDRGTLAWRRYSRHAAGLRVLGVDLGERFTAACAVWQTVSKAELEVACIKEGVTAPHADDLHFSLLRNDGRRLWFRRIGGGHLAAPWARLERSFLIKLPGEDAEPRAMTPEERKAFDQFLERVPGRKEEVKRVDLAMQAALREARRHLMRCGRLAKLSKALSEGDLKTAAGHWVQLCLGESPLADACKLKWTERIGTVPPKVEDLRGKGRKEAGERAAGECVKALTGQGEAAQNLAESFNVRWLAEDERGKELVRWLRRWVAPRGTDGKRSRMVGGLSMTRIDNFTALYRLERMWSARPKPEDTSSKPPQDDFCARLLKARDELRVNRVKTTASRIIEAALGLGREPKAAPDGRKPKRVRQAESDPRHAPCDVIAIENLSGYGTSETRFRRENRMLMNWAKSRIKKAIEEGAELYGLGVEEVQPNYTSRQDSRTGAPGVRGRSISAAALFDSPDWKRISERNDWSEKQKAYWDYLNNNKGKFAKQTMIFLPRQGGEIFVSSDQNSPLSHGIHADVNAAANIGLRVILDPDWAGRWWYVPVDRATGCPDSKEVRDKLKGCQAPGWQEVRLPGGTRDAKGKNRSIINAWREPCARPLNESNWKYTTDYWQEAEDRVFENLLARMRKDDG